MLVNIRSSAAGFADCLKLQTPHKVSLILRTPARWSGVRIPEEAKDFSILYNFHTICRAHSASFKMGTRVLSQDIPRGCDFGYAPPSGAEVKYRWGCTSSSSSFMVWRETIPSPQFSDPYSTSCCSMYSRNSYN